MDKTLEELVAETILQGTGETIDIDGHKFEITPPTPATVIMVSALVSKLPFVDRKTDNIMLEVLGTAKDLAVIGRIVAVLILGGKRVKENRMIRVKERREPRRRSWKNLFRKPSERWREVPEIDWLADKLLEETTNETLTKLVAERLGKMQLGHFFDLTASLSEANLLKRTREAVETVSGAKS